jgi:hypothetical protein
MIGKRVPIAPGQNRTDTRSLEGFYSTIELQARRMNKIIDNLFFFCNRLLHRLLLLRRAKWAIFRFFQIRNLN